MGAPVPWQAPAWFRRAGALFEAGMSATADVARSWNDLWQSSPTLAAALPGGLQSDDLATDQLRAGGAPRELPYAELDISLERAQRHHGLYSHLDYRRVEVNLYGTHKQALWDALSVVHGVFDPPAKLLFPWAGGTVIHCWTRPGLSEGDQPPPLAQRRAYVWRVFSAWLVVTERTKG